MDQTPPQNDKLRNWIGSIMVMLVLLPIFPFWMLPASLFGDPPWEETDTHAQLNTLKTAVVQYKTFNRQLPTTEQGLAALVIPPESARVKKGLLSDSGILDLWGNPFQYRAPSALPDKLFDIWSFGPDGVNGTEDDIYGE